MKNHLQGTLITIHIWYLKVTLSKFPLECFSEDVSDNLRVLGEYRYEDDWQVLKKRADSMVYNLDMRKVQLYLMNDIGIKFENKN